MLYVFSNGCLQDVTDLFGADLPVEGSEGGTFAWRDGPLLQALKAGSWIVLDEVPRTTNCSVTVVLLLDHLLYFCLSRKSIVLFH